MRIDRLLTRDEIPGFIAAVERPRNNGAAPPAVPADGAVPADATETPAVKPRTGPPLLGRGGLPSLPAIAGALPCRAGLCLAMLEVELL